MIIPATDAPMTLSRCEAALRSADAPPDEILVIDEPRHANAATARNLGAHRATGDVLVFVDSDVEVQPDAIVRIRGVFDSQPTLAAVFGSYDDSPAVAGVVPIFRNLLHHHVHHAAPGPATTFWTGLGAVRREAFLEIGGFDGTAEFMEDVDFGMRLTATGGRIALEPAIQGTHLKSWTLWGMIRTDFICRGVPWVLLLLRHRGSAIALKGSATTLNLGWQHRLSALASLVGTAAVATGRPRLGIAAALGLVGLNRRFYLLLLRRCGPRMAATGVLLHALHHLTSISSVPVGALLYVLERRRGHRLTRA